VVEVLSGSQVVSSSANANSAGSISVFARDLTIDGESSLIASENTSATGGAAGSILLDLDPLTISNGGQVTTNSTSGAAGDITIRLLRTGLMFLEGKSASGVVTTSSGASRGGRITISNPLAIISNGGDILALGQAGGANVNITTTTLISSSDRLNRVSVDGALVLDSQVQDVSRGLEEDVIPPVDIGEVLKNQCRAARLTGAISALRFTGIGHRRPPKRFTFLRKHDRARARDQA
jgi:hypothetical protein